MQVDMHGAMPRPSRVKTHGEELGKKDNDHESDATPTAPKWNAAIPRFRKRRWLVFILSLGFLYIFFKNMPEGLTPAAQRTDRRLPGRLINGRPIRQPPGGTGPLGQYPPKQKPQSIPAEIPIAKGAKKTSKPPKPDDGDAGPLRYYNGEIEFPLLMTSLQTESSTMRYTFSSNVLFMAGNLRTAAVLAPMVCEMARSTKNVVNFAYFGRDDLTMAEIQDANGVVGGCDAIWHDARPTHMVYSSDERYYKAAVEALVNIDMFLRPESYIIVDSIHEEKGMVDALKHPTGIAKRSVVGVPAEGIDKVMWMTRLDSKSLAAWEHLDISIIIHVTKENVGGLFRLLKSLFSADYTGHRYPSITFEIPADLDIPSENVVNGFVWPPEDKIAGHRKSQVKIRKRISHQHATPLESSIRMVEEFYPTQPIYEHVVVLSSNVELSRMWYHYLVFNILEYAYSTRSMSQIEPGLLAGFSLVTPLTHADQVKPFKPPSWIPPADHDPDLPAPSMDNADYVPFMWQSPDTMATLYFGHKWRELHSFLSLRVGLPSSPAPRKFPENVAPFVEPLNELMSLRGWYLLYPNLPAHHIAIYQSTSAIREEFVHLPSDEDRSATKAATDRDIDPYGKSIQGLEDVKHSEAVDTKALADFPIHTLIPNQGRLPELKTLPILDNDGKAITAQDIMQVAESRRKTFRTTHGRCKPDAIPEPSFLGAHDLFCIADGGSSAESASQEIALDWEAIKMQEDSKKSALGEASPVGSNNGIGSVLTEKQKVEQMKDEFLEHLQRQSAGSGAKADKSPSAS